jgi:hypothetical protein
MAPTFHGYRYSEDSLLDLYHQTFALSVEMDLLVDSNNTRLLQVNKKLFAILDAMTQSEEIKDFTLPVARINYGSQ